MKVYQRERHFRTRGGLHVTDITDEVREIVANPGVVDGICCVYSPHTTCCVRVNEFETGFFEDFAALLKRLDPTTPTTRTTTGTAGPRTSAERTWRSATATLTACRSMLLGSAGEVIPVADGDICLGQWQRILFMELDRERDCRWLVKVVGS